MSSGNTSRTLIIGWGHKARQGKDEACKHIISVYGDRYDIRRYAFGDLLKEEVYDALNDFRHPYWDQYRTVFNYLALPHPSSTAFSDTQPAEKVSWVDQHKSDPSLARLLQHWGTEYRRSQDAFYWVKAFRRRIELEKPQIALISDMRFKNEFYFVAAFGGYTVKVTRHGFQLADGRSTTHISEVDLDGIKFHFEIDVLDGEVEQLKKDAETVFEMIVAAQNPVQEVTDGDVELHAEAVVG